MGLSSKKHKQLLAYVKSEISRSVPEERIRRALITAGWPEKALDSVFKTMPNAHPDAILKINKLSKSFGQKKVLSDVNLEVTRGEIYGIIGLSGSGKTTLLNSVIGFLTPEKGQVFLRDPKTNHLLSVHKKPKYVSHVFGFAPQDPSFYSRLTCEENLDHFGSLYMIPREVRKTTIDSLLYLVELQAARKTLGRNLSGGMQRRLGIACSLIHNPKILILDEPTADLDPMMRLSVWNLITKINSQGTTVLITSHFLSEMEGICDKIAVLHDRSIVVSGTPDELKDNFTLNHEIHLELAIEDYKGVAKEIRRNKDVKKLDEKDHKLVIYTPKPEKTLHSLLHLVERRKEKVLDIEVNKPSLKEVFESYVSNKNQSCADS